MASHRELFKDFKALVEQGRWLEAEKYVKVLSIYYGQDPTFKELCGKLEQGLSSTPALKKFWYRYGSSAAGFVFTIVLVILFYRIALRKEN